ncbi:hypothetical protein [Luteimonas aquatica]|uniref:hypothetical protein n=1 Tax=Luteimonas aquatica TaxID=450364 RepID=UPI001F57A6BC|nr:hypothetical protein [Luteimonas aquatica]
MTGDPSGKPWYARVPALAAAGVAFLVALTTLVKNVSDMWAEKSAPASTPPAAAPAKPEPVAAAPQKIAVTLTLQKIEVVDDGSNGSTTWSFAVEAGGQPLFELAPRDYNDNEREVTPRGSDPSLARVVLVPGQEMLIKVTGRSPGVIGRTVLASGSAMLAGDGALAPVKVQAENGRAGSFVFHFATATAAQ